MKAKKGGLKRRKFTCSRCNRQGHSKRSCKALLSIPNPASASESTPAASPVKGGRVDVDAEGVTPASVEDSLSLPASEWSAQVEVHATSTEEGLVSVQATVALEGQLSLLDWIASLDGAHVRRWRGDR